jgi:hypothetical protein
MPITLSLLKSVFFFFVLKLTTFTSFSKIIKVIERINILSIFVFLNVLIIITICKYFVAYFTPNFFLFCIEIDNIYKFF